MFRIRQGFVLLLLGSALLALPMPAGAKGQLSPQAARPAPSPSRVSPVAVETLAVRPIYFEHVAGHPATAAGSPGRGELRARSGGFVVLPGTSRVELRRPGVEAVGLSFPGSADVEPTPRNRLPGVANYLIGNDPRRWEVGVPTYERVAYANLYPGIDAILYGSAAEQLEYDFVVAPGADPRLIRVRLSGAGTTLHSDGDLVLALGEDELRMNAPIAYQPGPDGVRQEVAARFALEPASGPGETLVRFELGAYDASLPLVIDPELVFSTFLGSKRGGSGIDFGNDVAVDRKGNIYVVGEERGSDFPEVGGAALGLGGTGDAFVTKLAPDGTIVYSTLIGGRSGDIATRVMVDRKGNAYIVGQTFSGDFPLVSPVQNRIAGLGDVFVAVLDTTGAKLTFSTYLGGSGNEFVTDAQLGEKRAAKNGLYVVGSTLSQDFPTVNPTQVDFGGGSIDGFISVFDLKKGALAFSTYEGGEVDDQLTSVSIHERRGDIYVTNLAEGNDSAYLAQFPPAPSTAPTSTSAKVKFIYEQPTSVLASNLLAGFQAGVLFNGGTKVFKSTLLSVVRPQPPATSLSAVPVRALAVETRVALAINGVCTIEPGAAGCTDLGMLLFLDEDLNPLDAANFGGPGPGATSVRDIAQGGDGTIYIGGLTVTDNLALVDPVQSKRKGSDDGFLIALSPDGHTTLFSTYLGGKNPDSVDAIAVDRDGNLIAVGTTMSRNFPKEEPLQRKLFGRTDAFITKIGGITGDARP